MLQVKAATIITNPNRLLLSTQSTKNILLLGSRRSISSSGYANRTIGNNSIYNQRLLLTQFHQQQHCHPQQHPYRLFSSFVLDGLGGGGSGSGGGTSGISTNWPITKTNTIFNIVPQGHKYVVERFGKLHSIEDSGFFFAIPFVDRIAYVIDIRERALDIAPQPAITRDNVSVEVSGNLFVVFVDPEKAAYGAFNPIYSVMQHAQSAMRSAIGEMELDEILHGRARLNSLVKGLLQEAAMPWGLEIRRYEITDVTPDQQIRIAMDKQAAAERDRREHVLRAEGEKQRTQLTSEGIKISLQNESEGNLVRVENEAKANKTRILREAEGQAESIRLIATAQANALEIIANQLNKKGGEEAARLALAKEYVAMYGEMGRESNTILFNERPADITALMAQAMTAINVATTNAGTGKQMNNKAIEKGNTKEDADENNSSMPSTYVLENVSNNDSNTK